MYVPGRQYLRDHLVRTVKAKRIRRFTNRRMTIDGSTTAGADDCFKPTKLIRSNGGLAAAAILSVMNRVCQIMGQWVVQSRSVKHLAGPLVALH